jgi:hypothetical protein
MEDIGLEQKGTSDYLQEFSFKNSANRMNKLGWVIL